MKRKIRDLLIGQCCVISMIVLDSNVWIRGSYASNDHAVGLLEAIHSGSKSTVVDAYIINEVQSAFDRQRGRLERQIIEHAEETFYTLLTRPSVTSCSQQEVRSLDHVEHRMDRYVLLLSDVLDIQAKDVPIVALAYEYRDDHPTIYTLDKSFSALNPAAYGLSELTIKSLHDTVPHE